MTADRDPQVGAALDLLEPVPPGPGFWAEVEGRLRAEQPAPVLQLARLPGAGPSPRDLRRRRTIAGVLAVAAVLLVALVTSALQDDRDPTETIPATTPSDGQGAQSPHITYKDGRTVGTGVGQLDPALIAVDAWAHAVANSDAALWQQLGPISKDTLGSQAALHDVLVAGSLKQQWSGIDLGNRKQEASVQCIPGDERGTCLVVISPVDHPESPLTSIAVERPIGTLTGQGLTTVEPFVPGNDLGFIAVGQTEGSDHVKSGQPLPLAIGTGSQAIVYLAGGGAAGPVGDRDLVRDASGAITGARFSEALWPSGPQPGPYFVAVLVSTPDGSIALQQRQVDVTGLG
jgi:hypothetical protein